MAKKRSAIFRDLFRQYSEEGYDPKESRKLARLEADEIMQDKEDFIENILSDTFDDR